MRGDSDFSWSLREQQKPAEADVSPAASSNGRKQQGAEGKGDRHEGEQGFEGLVGEEVGMWGGGRGKQRQGTEEGCGMGGEGGEEPCSLLPQLLCASAQTKAKMAVSWGTFPSTMPKLLGCQGAFKESDH